MKSNILVFIASFFFLLPFAPHTVDAQTKNTISPKVASLISHIVKQANRPNHHSKGDVYLLVSIEKTEYISELKSGRIVAQRKAKSAGGGFCGDYVAVGKKLLDQNKRQTGQGGGEILKLNKGEWEMVATAEGDYSCQKLRRVSQSVMKCLKIDCL
jgi:hypothetical protein